MRASGPEQVPDASRFIFLRNIKFFTGNEYESRSRDGIYE